MAQQAKPQPKKNEEEHWTKNYRKDEITPEYVNNKMESLMSALFDTIGENEERIKDLEAQVWKLSQALKVN
tara:strand:+ start:1300 stop:1512 length:213 start_codon:yes stop_codon:yes gene_type:complete